MKKIKHLIILTGLFLSLSASPVNVEASVNTESTPIVLTKKKATPTPKVKKATPTPKSNKSVTAVTKKAKKKTPVRTVGLSLALGGITSASCVFMHKKKTSGVGKRVENLDWDKNGVEVVNTRYVRTYKTVTKGAYK